MSIYPPKAKIIAACLLILGLLTGNILTDTIAQAGVSYQEPAGGWQYSYGGEFNEPIIGHQFVEGWDPSTSPVTYGTGPAGFGGFALDDNGNPQLDDETLALDGTWYHNQGDKWDGSAPGDPLSDPTVSADPPVSLTGKQGTSPGGAGRFVEGNTDYIRVQDAGNPEIHGWIQGLKDPDLTYPDPPLPPAPQIVPSEPINTNRRVYFGHAIASDFDTGDPLPNELILSVTGITVSFRTRIPDSGLLDDVYSDTNPPEVIPWFQDAPNGRGMPMTNGRGTINIVQNNPANNDDTLVGFSLVNSTDVAAFCGVSGGALCTGSGSGGLIMNNLIGNTPSSNIDSGGTGTLNMLEVTDDDLNEWNEFWITMENNGGTTGNIRVTVYMNGDTTPAQTFDVTLAAPGNASYKDEDAPYLEFGISDNGGFGSFDMDFLSYKLGVIAPIAAPIENADFDADGDVDGTDFLIWQRGFGIDSGATLAQGDANSDGKVNAADMTIWQGQFGITSPAQATLASVPEPTGLALLALGLLAVGGPARRTLWY